MMREHDVVKKGERYGVEHENETKAKVRCSKEAVVAMRRSMVCDDIYSIFYYRL